MAEEKEPDDVTAPVAPAPDPNVAAAQFQRALGYVPTHYGATFRLATALDQAGKPAEARPLWEKMLRMAEAIRDTATADRARARLAKSP